MNVDRGKESFTPEEEADLRAQVQAYRAEHGLTWQALARKMGIPSGSISPWVGGSYNGGKVAGSICAAVQRFFLHAGTQEEIAQSAPIVPGFQPTRTAKRVMGVLAYGHTGEMVVIVGDPGVGKTAAIDQYVATGVNVSKATMSPSSRRINACLVRVLRGMGSQRAGGATQILTEIVRARVSGAGALIIVDEAQHLDEAALEELRSIHDATGCGLALCGNREVLTRLQGVSRGAAFAQLHSRVSNRLIIPNPLPEDVALLLEAWGVADLKQAEFLRGIALKPGGGAVRSLTKVLKYATILAQQEDEGERVLDHLKDAWTQLSTRSAVA